MNGWKNGPNFWWVMDETANCIYTIPLPQWQIKRSWLVKWQNLSKFFKLLSFSQGQKSKRRRTQCWIMCNSLLDRKCFGTKWNFESELEISDLYLVSKHSFSLKVNYTWSGPLFCLDGGSNFWISSKASSCWKNNKQYNSQYFSIAFDKCKSTFFVNLVERTYVLLLRLKINSCTYDGKNTLLEDCGMLHYLIYWIRE